MTDDLYYAISRITYDFLEQKRRAIAQWVEQSRKYPDGFKFSYNGEEAEITGATCSIDEHTELGDIPEDYYIIYSCYVPSWCDRPLNSEHPSFGLSEAIGKKPNSGVVVPEFAIDAVLREG